MASASDAPEVAYGGQAVVEGVMIRSPHYVAVACRLPQADGSHGVDTPIDVLTEPVRSLFSRLPWLRRIPLLRGFFALFEMLGIGLRALERSANLQTVVVASLSAMLAVDTAPAPRRDEQGELNGPILWATIGTAFAIGLGLFVLLPNFTANWLGTRLGFGDHSTPKALIEGAIVLTFFVAYVVLIGQMAEIRRVFQYHGAEHKVVNAHEAGLTPTVDAVQPMSVIHPRCGTSFVFFIIVIGIFVHALLPWYPNHLQRLALRLSCLPLVAGIGFEWIKFVGAQRRCSWLQALIAPGLLMQRLTTRQPTPDMIEVALASFEAVKLAEETGTITSEVRGAPSVDQEPSNG